MKIIGVIPARYNSSRLPGKPLADICGKPMIWWVYQQVKKVIELNDVIVATDDCRIKSVCDMYSINSIITGKDTPNHIHRIWEVSEQIEADYYICVNGDEPIIDSSSIEMILPTEISEGPLVMGAMRLLTNPAETIDFANIKIVVTNNGRCLYMSRNPIPYPKGTLSFQYKKYVGIECFNKKALNSFISSEMSELEKIEDIDHLRFLENNIPLYFHLVNSDSLSVDTPKDLEKVRGIIQSRLDSGELSI